MKGYLSIASIILCLSLAAQNRTLKKESFQKLELSQSWIIVKYRHESNMAPGTSLKAKPTANSKKSILDGMKKIAIPEGEDPVSFCNQYLSDPNVIYAEPIVQDRPLEIPSDPFIEDQYYLENIRAFDAWDITKGDDDIAVAIIDTGMDLDHEDLKENLWLNLNDTIDGIDNDENGFVDDYFGYDFADGDNDPESDLDDHGAIVGGIVGATADNELGIAGIGYHTKIASLKGFNSTDNLSGGLFDAILYAVDNGIEILNLSWGSIREPLQSEQDIINYAVLEKDVIVVAAAGNDGNKSTAEEKFYPASYDNVLSVAGSTSDDTKWSGSSYNHSVDLIAPASGILSTSNGNGYNPNGVGTSFASPMVAATAALVKDQYPDLTAQQIMERVRVTADDIYEVGANSTFDGKLGRGRLNAYRALSESGLKSLRVENVIAQKPSDDPVFYGDTLSITLDLTNYLEGLSDPAIYVSSPDDEFTSSTDDFFPGGIGTLASTPMAFEIILSEELAPETTVDVRLDFQDGAYADFQFIDIETAPDYADFDNDQVSLSVAGDGRLGIIDYDLGSGNGFSFQADNLLHYAGIMIAADQENVSDNIISNFNTPERDNDFTTITYYKIGHHPFADRYGYSEFTDNNHSLLIEQSNITSQSGAFLINRYRIVNTGVDTLKNLSFGVFADWDLGDFTANYSAYDQDDNYLFTQNEDTTLLAGTKLIGNGTINYSALDIDNLNGNEADVTDTFSDSAKYRFLADTTIDAAGENGPGNDVAGLIGIAIEELAPGCFQYIDLYFAVGNSKSELTSNFQFTEEYFNSYQEYPQILETLISCNGGTPTIDPEGDSFIFYEDARGLVTIDTASAFTPSAIDRDTSFYVRNVDSGYPSEIREIRIQLFDDIAAFDIDQDTLYLDNTTNIALFTDQSIDAISWAWDFGNGTQSNLQNPSILFNEPGTYTVTLTVENSFGCSDSATKSLVVADRPADLVFDDILICPNETISLSNELASKLFLYNSQSQLNPIASGEVIQAGPFEKDTTLFVSGIVNELLTNRTPLKVNVQEVLADIFIRPDTLSDQLMLRAIAAVDENTSIEWLVNGSAVGNDQEIVVEAVAGIQTFELIATNENDCQITNSATFEVSTSITPVVSSITGCEGSVAVLKPQNGIYFGFYEDDALTQLISKGTQLEVTENIKLYVVNLDDGLPGKAVEADVTFEDLQPEISYEITDVGEQNKVAFTVNSEVAINSYQWYIDGEKSEISSSPIFFFEDRLIEVVLEAESNNGCLSSDTVQLDLIPPEIPLGTKETRDFDVYPNPTKGLITISTAQSFDLISVKDLSGKEVMIQFGNTSELDLVGLSPGLYVLEFQLGDKTEKVKVVLEK